MLDTSHGRSTHGYRMPRRFTVAQILAMMTVFAALFGVLRCFGAPPVLYLFLGTQAVAVCLVQMKFGDVPRGASMLVGCVFLPVWVGSFLLFGGSGMMGFPPSRTGGAWLPGLPFIIAFGGLLGYCTGTVVAGVFLVLDLADGVVQRAARRRARLP
jgi:hypothetical protein